MGLGIGRRRSGASEAGEAVNDEAPADLTLQFAKLIGKAIANDPTSCSRGWMGNPRTGTANRLPICSRTYD